MVWIIKKIIFPRRARLNRELDLQFEPTALFLHRQRHIHHLSHLPLLAMTGYDHCPEAKIVECDGCRGRGVQFVQCHAVALDGSPALHDDERAAGDDGQRGQGLGGGDGRGDGDGVNNEGGQFSGIDFFF